MIKNHHLVLILQIFLLLIFGFRFFVEFVKENQSAFEQGLTLNMGQIVSIPFVIAGLYFIFRKAKEIENKKVKSKTAH